MKNKLHIFYNSLFHFFQFHFFWNCDQPDAAQLLKICWNAPVLILNFQNFGVTGNFGSIMVEKPIWYVLPKILLSHIFGFLWQCCIETEQVMVKNKSLLLGQPSLNKPKNTTERQATHRRGISRKLDLRSGTFSGTQDLRPNT